MNPDLDKRYHSNITVCKSSIISDAIARIKNTDTEALSDYIFKNMRSRYKSYTSYNQAYQTLGWDNINNIMSDIEQYKILNAGTIRRIDKINKDASRQKK